nr:hypothetical protein CFP56_53712 [Quercus suber]
MVSVCRCGRPLLRYDKMSSDGRRFTLMGWWEISRRWKRGDELQAAENSIRCESSGPGPSCRRTDSLANFCVAVFECDREPL